MTLLNEIIDIKITTIKGNTTTQDFNSVLVMVEDVPTADFGAQTIVKQYTKIEDVYKDFGANTEARAIADKIFSQPYVPNKILFSTTRGDAETTFIELYNAVTAIRDDFKFIISTADDSETILEVAGLAETHKKIYGVTSADANIVNPQITTDILSTLKSEGLTRTFLFYTPVVGGNREFYIEAALISYMSQYAVGSATWAFKQLVSVTPSNLSDVERATLKDKNGNYYSEFAGKNSTFFGTLVSGDYIDTRVGLDWLEQTMKENLASLLTDQGVGKIPYKQDGIDLVANNVRATLLQAADRSIITDDFKIFTPNYLDVSLADKTARVLNNVSFSATFSGAIHKIAINGIISY